MISVETFIKDLEEGQGKTKVNPSRSFHEVVQGMLRHIIIAGIFLTPFIPLIVTNGMAFPHVTGKNFTFRIITEIIFAAWILMALYEPQYRPRFSWIFATLSNFVVIIFFADIFGIDPIKSLWGNFERMEGFVTLAHLFMYFIVVSSSLRSEKIWCKLFNTSLIVAVIVSLLATQEIFQGIERIGGTLGKSTFLAIYTLTHTFISLLMLTKTKNNWLKFLYIVAAIFFIFILFNTITRGAILGLVAGLFATTLYITIFGREYKTARKLALGGLISISLITGSFLAARNTEFVQEKPILSRIASISIDSGEARFNLWGIAYEGFRERPLFGWGQENYNYVFSRHYRPSLYSQEQWFDRAHNVLLEWLIAGGLLGLCAYVSLFLSAVYYLTIKPFLEKEDNSFALLERGIVLGLLSGYLIHNLFVFDDIVSYIFFVTILGFIHMRVSAPISKANTAVISKKITTSFIVPITAVGLIVSIYLLNIPGIQASTDFARAHFVLSAADAGISPTNGFRAPLTLEQRDALYLQAIALYDSALTKQRYADQETVEQLALIAPIFFNNQKLSTSTKEKFMEMAETGLSRQILDRPKDAKLQAFAASFYGSLGDTERALGHYQIARELSPKKQPILFSIGLIHLKNGRPEEAKEVFKEAYEYAPSFSKARNLYAVSAIYTGDWKLFYELIDSEHEHSFLESDFGVEALYDTGNFNLLESMLLRYTATTPDNLQRRILLALVQSELGNTTQAIQTTKETMVIFPQFKLEGEKIIENLLKKDQNN